MSLPQQAEALKVEGNALYLAGDHNAAIKKYTAAVNIVSDNAVLFANRAACHLALKQFEQACQDAQKATELDPKYAKGWGRLGAAFEGLSKYKEALDAYSQAIECIDAISPLSDADKRLKAQYKSAHTNMDLRAEARHFTIQESEVKDKKMPWELVREMYYDLPAESSVSGQIILGAWETFDISKKMLKSVIVFPNGLMHGQNGGLDALSNAILTDERCIILRGGDSSLVQDYNQYLQFLAGQFNPWFDIKKPQEVIRLAKARLRQTQNWDSVRGALACQARSWIVLGFMGKITGQSREELYLWYDRTCKLIELGRAEWPDIPREVRGTIFGETFLRGVQVHRMHAYMQAYEVKHFRTSGKFTLDGLMALADEILTQLENTPPEQVESMRTPETPPYFYLAFYLYPKASAWSIRGYVYYRKGNFESEDTTTLEDREWAKKSGEAYIKAANLFPEDDENHCFMLRYAIQSYAAAKITVREMFLIMERLRLTYPKMQRIWRNSTSALQGMHKELVQLMDAEKVFKRMLAAGDFTLDDPVMFQIQ